MAIKNIMEDIVASVTSEVLSKEGKDLPDSQMHREDIMAYVLNKVPARYITSERGMLHDRMESRLVFQQRTDILFLVHEAIEFVKNRRSTPKHTDYGSLKARKHILPHIFGEILEETTFSYIPGVEITLLFRDKAVSMIDEGWSNPYMTMKATKGFYQFWPDYNEKEMGGGPEIPFTLLFRHEKFSDLRVDLRLMVQDGFGLHESQVIPITLMKLHEGEDVSFLYE